MRLKLSLDRHQVKRSFDSTMPRGNVATDQDGVTHAAPKGVVANCHATSSKIPQITPSMACQ